MPDQQAQQTQSGSHSDSLFGLAGRGLDWLLGQQANTIALFAIFGLMGWLAYYAANFAIPAHLSQIQAGYEKIEAQQTKQIEALTTSFDRRADEANYLLRELLELKRRPTIAPADRTTN